MLNEVKSPSCSIVVTLHAHITSLVVYVICISVIELTTSELHVGTVNSWAKIVLVLNCNMYLFRPTHARRVLGEVRKGSKNEVRCSITCS